MSLVEHRTAHGWTVLSPTGRLDAHTSQPLEEDLLARVTPNLKLALDLGSVDYMSSAGLRVLMKVFKACQTGGGNMVLLNPLPNVREVLDISGFLQIIPVLDAEANLPA
uniref:Anti-sigma factor antagonist n=1 Tax=Desulfatirhabdium butyrativorans TaxID=340467 RepID=A0A7C4VRS2_9BACT